ncbi:glycosyltransferase family 2 protein [Paenibacillus sp. P25]|nr:glycosyltransferase family 2 protein [Paenibacillus sp. P25]
MECMKSNISVVIATHKRPVYLDKALESVFRQTVLPAEIIVSEDGLDPETERVVTRYRGRGIPIRYERHEPKLGQLKNRNAALQLASCEYVAILDDDDEWCETYLQKTWEALEHHPQCGFCFTDHYLIDTQGNILHEESDRCSQQFGRAAQ